jgi:hypothetical protein
MQNKNHTLSRLTRAAAFCLVAFSSITAMAQHSESKVSMDIEKLMLADEFKAHEREQLRVLPKESVPIILEKLQRAESAGEESRLIAMLAIKLEQYRTQIPETQIALVVDTIVQKCETSEGVVLQQRLMSVEAVKDVKIDQMANRLTQGSDLAVRKTATKLLEQRAETGSKQAAAAGGDEREPPVNSR